MFYDPFSFATFNTPESPEFPITQNTENKKRNHKFHTLDFLRLDSISVPIIISSIYLLRMVIFQTIKSTFFSFKRSFLGRIHFSMLLSHALCRFLLLLFATKNGNPFQTEKIFFQWKVPGLSGFSWSLT